MSSSNNSDSSYQIRVDEALKHSFQEAAKQNHRTGADLLREFMTQYVKNNAQGELKL